MTSAFTGQRVVVAGIGVSGIACTEVLLDLGAVVVVIDKRHGPEVQAPAERLRDAGAEVRLGDAETPIDADLVVASPGWRPDQPFLATATNAGVDVIGEPELAWRLRDPNTRWLGVTGTNGKTTTVGMLESILTAGGLRAVAAGNVGYPLIRAVRADPGYDVLAVEISSQQLTWSPSVRFTASAILNIAADHLDWHDTMAAYRAAKQQIWREAIAIGNADDPEVRDMLPPGARVFSVTDPAADYAFVDGALVDNYAGVPMVAAADVHVAGTHNIANALAAAGVARAAGLPVDAVKAGLRAVQPGPHRNALVDTVDSVAYVDDSKATNPHAVAASLSAYPSVVWVAGGLLKGVDVEPVVAEQAHRLRAVVLLGRDRQQIADALARHAPNVPVVEVAATDTGAMTQVVAAAARLAEPGDTVLLAPAGASWDMFRDYADRGEQFAAAVRALRGGVA